jgi:hypothetical protein
MATRTISNTGGNYNSTATWVEGVVPTSADDIVATATSGQLTINVASAARSIDLTNYANTITFNNNWTLGGGAVTNIIGDTNTQYAGTGSLIINQVNNVSQNNTNRIPELVFGGNKTLLTDLYAANFRLGGTTLTVNGFTIYSNGNLGLLTTSTVPGDVMIGSTNIVCDGSGLMSFAYNCSGSLTINTAGEYNTVGRSLILGAGAQNANPTFNFISGTTSTFALILFKGGGVDSFTFGTINVPFDVFIYSTPTSTAGNNNRLTLNITNPTIINSLNTLNVGRFRTSDLRAPDIYILGNNFSATTTNFSSIFGTASALTNPPAAGAILFKTPDLYLDPLYSFHLGNVAYAGVASTKSTIKSSTSGTKVNLSLNRTGSQIINVDFTDVNAVGDEIVTINGTLSNTTNITNVYPTAGGGGGGSFAFTYVN